MVWLLCGSRFFTQSGAISLARCRHWSDRFGRATLLVALEAQQTYAASSLTIVHTLNAELGKQ
jgi:hypothetical protein